MMDNTLENKRKFFAQYFGQNVLKKNIEGLESFITSVDGFVRDPGLETYLELTPLSKISDEDAIEVAKCMNVDVENQIKQQVLTFINACISHFYIKSDMSFKIADLLRSKGYALPWMGLSVEQQIEYGWVKLKEVSNG